MKVAVINFSGNVGKSTVARHLIAPRMNNAVIIPVESINSDGTSDAAIKGKQFGELQEALLLMDDAVVDVGASNVEDFITLMTQYKGSHEDFDYYVVPVVPKNKQMRDTISTIDALASIGVPAKKIRVVFNMIDVDDEAKRVCSGIFDYCDAAKNFIVKPAAVIHTNDVYGKLKGEQQDLAGILADSTDYKELIKTAKTSEDKINYAQRIAIKRLASGVVGELDSVFKALFSK